MRHVYWEARFDVLQPNPPRAVIRELRDHEFPACDRLVEEVVARTLFSFKMDKRIFDSFIAVHDLDQWHRIIARISQRSRHAFPLELVEQYNAACGASIVDLFQQARDAACQRADPTGFRALEQAKRVRTTLRTLMRRGRITQGLEARLIAMDENRDLELPCCKPLSKASADEA